MKTCSEAAPELGDLSWGIPQRNRSAISALFTAIESYRIIILIIYLRKYGKMSYDSNRQAGTEPITEIKVTPQMLQAGVARFCDLPLEEVDPTYVVSAVLEAMGLEFASPAE